jgi:putative transposase
MPRTSRASRGGFVYHVLNRGNGGSDVFHNDDDFAAFVNLMREAHEKVPMRLTGFCLMPNHFHLLLWPHKDGDLSRWMQWLMTSQVRRYHRQYKGSGHVWQGRFKAFPVQSDDHYLTVLRYVERNPLRANIVERSQDWEWSSLKPTVRSGLQGLLSDGPIDKPAQWTRHVNGVQTDAEVKSLRHSLARGTPFGDARWQASTAKQLGLESSLQPRGRPRIPNK